MTAPRKRDKAHAMPQESRRQPPVLSRDSGMQSQSKVWFYKLIGTPTCKAFGSSWRDERSTRDARCHGTNYSISRRGITVIKVILHVCETLTYEPASRRSLSTILSRQVDLFVSEFIKNSKLAALNLHWNEATNCECAPPGNVSGACGCDFTAHGYNYTGRALH